MAHNRIDLKEPIYVRGRSAEAVVFVFPNGNFALKMQGEVKLRQFNRYGAPIDVNWDQATNDGPVTTEVVTLYPNGAIYQKEAPVRSSSYGVDQIIQVRVTKRGDKIISKELLP